MDRFRVWVRPLGGGACKIRVDGLVNAKWLLDRLSRTFVFKNCRPLIEEEGSAYCTFQVPQSFQSSMSTLTRLLVAIPQVDLMLDPA